VYESENLRKMQDAKSCGQDCLPKVRLIPRRRQGIKKRASLETVLADRHLLCSCDRAADLHKNNHELHHDRHHGSYQRRIGLPADLGFHQVIKEEKSRKQAARLMIPRAFAEI
jgi:hypothetical protein